MNAQATWYVRRNREHNIIYSAYCLKLVKTKVNANPMACALCKELKSNCSLISAINHTYTTDDTLKFVPQKLMTMDAFNSTLRKFEDLRQLQNTLDSSRNGDLRKCFNNMAILTRKGLFKDQEAVRGIIMGCCIRAKRKQGWKSTWGMWIDTYLDGFLTTLCAMSKGALKLLNENFSVQTLRSPSIISAKSAMFLKDGLHPEKLKQVAQDFSNLGYTRPVPAVSDQTACVKALRHHNGCIVGAQGGDVPFTTPEELRESVKNSKRITCALRYAPSLIHSFTDLSWSCRSNMLYIWAYTI